MVEQVAKLVKKYNGRTLQDDGCVVSREYRYFQNAFHKAMGAIAESIGAKVVKTYNGHYDMSGFIERDGKFVYYCYSVIWLRTNVRLDDRSAMYVRSAKSVTDFHGGSNNHVAFVDCANVIDKILNQGF